MEKSSQSNPVAARRWTLEAAEGAEWETIAFSLSCVADDVRGFSTRLAEKAGVDRRDLPGWLKRGVEPRATVALRLLAAFEVVLDEMIAEGKVVIPDEVRGVVTRKGRVELRLVAV